MKEENFLMNPTSMGGGAGGFGGETMGGTPGRAGTSVMGGTGGNYGGMESGMGGGVDTNNPWRIYTKESPTVMVEAKYRLFRYFDFTVEPGKSYQYRVRLAVYNPNHRMNDSILEEEAVATKKEPIIWSEFSYPSGTAAVNSNARVLAKSVGNIPLANRVWQPQIVTVSSIVFDETDNEDYIVKDKRNITLGTVLNFRNEMSQKVSEIISPTITANITTETTQRGRSRTQTAAPKTSAKSLNHISDVCVLDVVGKRKLIGSNIEHTPPGQVMFMAFDGTIEIQSIKSNKLELDRYEKPATTTTSGEGM